MTKKENILVTGGAGAIGQHLVMALLRRGHSVHVIDNLSSGAKANLPESSRLCFYRGGIQSDAVLKKVFQKKIDRVFHLAAFFANQNSIDHPEEDLLVNGMGTLKVLQHAKHAKSILIASTSCFYHKSEKPLHEESEYCFETPYAISKYMSERYADFYFRYHKSPVIIVRYFNVYGPGEFPGLYRNVIPKFFAQAMQRQPLRITGDGQETRSFTYISDVIDGTIKAAYSKEFGEVFNIGSTQETKISFLAKKINAITRNVAGVRYTKRRDWDNTQRKKCSIRKARRILKYQPKVSLDEGLRLVYQWCCTRKEFTHGR